MKFLAELRQRRLVQITLSYIAGAWIGLTFIDQVVDRGILPEIVYRVALLWAFVGGLPAAMIIGWYHGEKGRQKVPPQELAMLALVAIVALSLGGFTVTNQREGPLPGADGTLDLRRVAVLYFDGSNLPTEQRYLADALTEDLIDELAQVRALSVVSRHGSHEVRDLALPRDSIARRLEAGTLVEGMVEQRGERMQIALRLFDGASGVEYQRASFEAPAASVLEVRDELIEQASRLLREFLGEELALRQRGAGTRVTAAWSAVQQAERLRKDALAAAQSDLLRAMELFDQADGMLARAEQLDTAWVEPIVLRSEVAYRRGRALLDSPRDAEEALRAGLEHAERALGRSRSHARALAARGTIQYVLHLLHVEPDPARHAALLDRGREDLERAVQLDPDLADAHGMLSHLYAAENLAAALVAAQRAFDADAFLEAAPTVLWRLFSWSMEMGSFTPALRWCNEGARRFPDSYRFAACELYLMTTTALQPSVERAWELTARVESLVPAVDRDYEGIRSELYVGGVIARAGRPDSARAVLRRARNRIDPAQDPGADLQWTAAYMYVLLRDHDEAINVLRRAVAMSHGFSRQGEINWRWRELQRHPEFVDLYMRN